MGIVTFEDFALIFDALLQQKSLVYKGIPAHVTIASQYLQTHNRRLFIEEDSHGNKICYRLEYRRK
jgi:hypothetical protein